MFNPNDEVVCVNTESYCGIKKGIVYKVSLNHSKFNNNTVLIEINNSHQKEWWYPSRLFKKYKEVKELANWPEWRV